MWAGPLYYNSMEGCYNIVREGPQRNRLLRQEAEQRWVSWRCTFIWKCPDLRVGAYGLGRKSTEVRSLREYPGIHGGNGWCVTNTDCKIRAEKRQSSDGDFSSPDICSKSHLVHSRTPHRSLTCFANSFFSLEDNVSQGNYHPVLISGQPEESVGISTVLSNLGGSHCIISEFRIGWQGKDSPIYYNAFSWIPNSLNTTWHEIFGRQTYISSRKFSFSCATQYDLKENGK